MKKPTSKPAALAAGADPDEILPEYDFRKGRRNPYSARLAGARIVVVDSDLVELFPTSAAVNRALRAVARARRNPPPSATRKRSRQRDK